MKSVSIKFDPEHNGGLMVSTRIENALTDERHVYVRFRGDKAVEAACLFCAFMNGDFLTVYGSSDFEQYFRDNFELTEEDRYSADGSRFNTEFVGLHFYRPKAKNNLLYLRVPTLISVEGVVGQFMHEILGIIRKKNDGRFESMQRQNRHLKYEGNLTRVFPTMKEAQDFLIDEIPEQFQHKITGDPVYYNEDIFD